MAIKAFKILKRFALASVGFAALGYGFLNLHPVFGGKPDEKSLARIKASKAFDGEKFTNLEPTILQTGDNMPSIWEWGLSMLNPPKGKNPSKPLPSVKFQADELVENSFAWLGHSSVIFRLKGKNIITDPVFYKASPIPFTGKPFKYENTPEISQLPFIDAVIISHDHYDHLDYRTVKEMDEKVGRYFVPLGVRAHLLRWGVEDSKIIELDIDESVKFDEIELILTTSRHFSGRGFDTRYSTLWGAWIIKTPEISILFGGDSGYGKHYEKLGELYGKFDIAMLENGAYDDNWNQIHMMPEQAATAASELNASALLPIHWAKFDLAYHNWDEPIKRLLKASEKSNFTLITPKIGEIFTLRNLPQDMWWRD